MIPKSTTNNSQPSMDQQSLINALLGIVCGGLGWFSRELWSAVKELKADLAELNADMPQKYVQKDDFREDIKEIKEMLGKLFDKLDQKADK